MTGAALSSKEANRRKLSQLLTALFALAIVGGIVSLLISLLWPNHPAPPAKMPFGLPRETAPSSGGLSGYIVTFQSCFYKVLTSHVLAVKENGGAIWPLLGVGFAYGVFHAAGPGHGKGVISAYLLASERALKKGLGLCFAAALLQALIAITIATIATVLLNATAKQMDTWSNAIEMICFAIIALFGLRLTWRKAGKYLALLDGFRGKQSYFPGTECDHVHLQSPEEIDRMQHWRDYVGVVLATGTRPCSGALIILVFTYSQGLFLSGIAATFAMALGTAITTGLIATMAVFSKSIALKLAGGRSIILPVLFAAFELAACAFIAVLGISLIFGLWNASATT